MPKLDGMAVGVPGASGEVGLPLPCQDQRVGVLKAADPARDGSEGWARGSLRTEGQSLVHAII